MATKQQLEARVAELESQLADAEQALTGEAPVAPVDGPEIGTPVWIEASNGQEWYVEAGTDTYQRLMAEGGVIVEPPAA